MAGKKGMRWAAKIISPTNIEQLRISIEAEKLIQALKEHAVGIKEMSATQVTAALGLVRKVLPDKTETAHSGESTVNHVITGDDARREIMRRLAPQSAGNGALVPAPERLQ
jgi:N-methylhydantoinase B/oxoprolinase/acetone carboxylase alpha subunit